MKVLVYDIETDNLLMDATTIFCLVTKDINTGEIREFTPDNMHEAWDHLCSADRLIGHNCRMFDDPCTTKLIGDGRSLPTSIDTIVMSRLLYPQDSFNPAGGHSLAKWGDYLKCEKLPFKDFTKFSQEMLVYCRQDVEVTEKLYRFLAPKAKEFSEALRLEHDVSSILVKQVMNGVGINDTKLTELLDLMAVENFEYLEQMRSVIKPWFKISWLKKPKYYYHPDTMEAYAKKGDCRPKLRKELVDGPLCYKLEVTEFNPNSPAHILKHFMGRRGWKPWKKTKSGGWATDGDIIKELSEKYPEAVPLHKYNIVQQTFKLAKSWNEKRRGNRLHGDIRCIGTAPHRMAHSNPNLGQVPKAKKKAPYGQECRECFIPRSGWVQVGCDASGLQARMLGHWLAAYDNGAYAKVILEGDIHSHNQAVVSEVVDNVDRDTAKTILYAYLFGAMDTKLGSSVGGKAKEGAKIRAALEAGIHGLDELQAHLAAQVRKSAYITTLDGRRVPTEQERVALNYLLMSSEAIIMKRALVMFDAAATDRYGEHGKRWAYMLNVHDEVGLECEPEIAYDIGDLFRDSIIKAGEFYNLNIPLDGEPKVGNNWHETH